MDVILGFIFFTVAAVFLIRYIVSFKARELAVSVALAGIATLLIGWATWLGVIGIVAGILGFIILRIPTAPTWLSRLVTVPAAFLLVGAFLFALVGVVFDDDGQPRERRASADPAPTTTIVEDEDCPDSWAIEEISEQEHNRLYGAGVQSIREATTDEEARAAAHDWLELSKRDPDYLAGVAAYFLHRTVDPATLVEADGKCASGAAKSLLVESETAFAFAEITPDEAPADGTNSGVSAEGDVVAASHAGITGDRTAVKVVLQDGTTVWLMARCGNPVVVGEAPVPPGPTDEPPPANPPPETPDEPEGGPEPCPPPVGVRPDQWDYEKCRKKNQTFDQQQNESPARQDPQDNRTSGVNTGPTPGAPPVAPTPNPPGPTPQPNTPAPDPNPGGYDSGSGSGNNTPGGSTCDNNGCSGGGSTPPSGPPVTVDDGNHSSDPGGF